MRSIPQDFNKESAPVLADATNQALPLLMDLTKGALPMAAEISKATVNSIDTYTAALKKYNAEGGAFPQPPKNIRPFGQAFQQDTPQYY